jgi:hypothetical protein
MLPRFRSSAVLASALALMAAVMVPSTSADAAKAKPNAASAQPRAPDVEILGSNLIELASAYRAYLTRISGVTPAFSDGASIAKSLEVGASYEPKQLLRGAIAYGAVVALQDKAFVAGVRSYGSDATQRHAIASAIVDNPYYALALTGATSAAGQVQQAFGSEGQALYDNGKAVKQSAYDIQKQDWSKSSIIDREGRLAKAKALSATPLTGDPAERVRLLQASKAIVSLGVPVTAASQPYTPVVVRSLAIAALGLLGEASDTNTETLLAVMAEPGAGFCLSLAKLNLYQCLAVAKPHYEDVFCLGQHAMMDTGRCLIKASGRPEPFEAKFVPVVNASHGYVVKKKPTKKKPSKKR